MAKLLLYNTLSREKEEFVPLHKGKAGLYTCGPTVYDYAHIGNLRSYIFADILRRTLEYDGYAVTQVMNITDVGHLTSDADEGEDKMEKGARREHKTVWEIAEHFTKAFKEDIAKLDIEPPSIWCKATEHITEQIAQVQALEKKGVTYRTSDGIYFDTSKLDDYGKLARLKTEDLEAGARIEMGEKRHKTDFALWKFSPKDAKRQMEWESPWGTGFPGWHIECSAMSSKYLGEQFDIHTGGIDHIPVHHTNEIAQAETAFGTKPWVRYWVHGEFLVLEKGKMAKSGENFLTLAVLEEKGYDPLDYRYLCLTAHYRQQLTFSWEAMDSAKQSRQRLMNIVGDITRSTGPRLEVIVDTEKKETKQVNELDAKKDNEKKRKAYEDRFTDSVNDDLNIPQGLATLWNALRERKISLKDKKHLIESFDRILGLRLLAQEEIEIPAEIAELAEEREKARKAKDFARSDRLRDEIRKKGWRVDDQKDGYRLKPFQDRRPS